MPQEVIIRVEQLADAQDMLPELAFGNRDNQLIAAEVADDEDKADEFVPEAHSFDEDLEYNTDEEAEIVPENGAEHIDQDPGNHVNQIENNVADLVENEGVHNAAELQAELQVDEILPEEEGVQDDNVLPDNDDDLVIEDAENQGVQIELDAKNQGVQIEPLEQLVQADDNDQSNRTNMAAAATWNPAHGEGHANGDDLDRIMDQQYGPRSGRYNLRHRRPRTFEHKFGRDIYNTLSGLEESLATPQMSMRQGVKLFGDAGVQAVKKEIKQLHDQGVIHGKNVKDLTAEQHCLALGYLMFLKQKCDGLIKARGCADGRIQRGCISPKDTISPTVSTEAVFLTAIINALEGQYVAVVDIPEAFMHANIVKDVFMKLDGLMATLLMEVDPEMYMPYLTYEHGKPVIYVEMLKTLYGTLQAARLFWEKFSGHLVEWGFDINPYDSCVANKMIDSSQCTITWHVDDLKISHKLPNTVTGIIAQLESTFGAIGELSVSHGIQHDYLGMFLDFTEPGKLQVDMHPYIQTILSKLPDTFDGEAVTPVAAHLFDVDAEGTPLEKERAEMFHSVTMQLMYLAQCGRPDICTAVAFLSTRVSAPDEHNFRKLIRVIRYLQGTLDVVLTLECDGTGKLKWWVDASYAVHPNMRGHTGGTLSLGSGSAISFSSKQKLVSLSSTESELIGVHDVLPQIIWTCHFLEAQGFPVQDVILYQDNMSTIMLEKNGRASSTKYTKHINIRYFFVKDQVDKKVLRVEYCPTEDMLGDFFTKPLQGHLFCQLRDAIMNVDPSSPYHSGQRSLLTGHKSGGTADEEQTEVVRGSNSDMAVIIANKGELPANKAELPTSQQRKLIVGKIERG